MRIIHTRLTLPGFVMASFILLMSGCTRDTGAPVLERLLVNTVEDIHHHGNAGQVNTIEARWMDEGGLWKGKVSISPGLHHGTDMPMGLIFTPMVQGNWSDAQTIELNGTDARAVFRMMIPWQVSGPHTLMVESLDEEGNMQKQAWHFDVFSDSLPSISVDVPANATGPDNTLAGATGSVIDMGVQCIDLVGLASVRLALQTPAGQVIWQEEVIVPGDNVFQNPSWMLPVPSAAGQYRVFVRAVNTRGYFQEHWAVLRVNI
jgi:hypothetical protein